MPSDPVSFPPMVQLLDEALALRGASMVIYRARTLIEFKTELLSPRVAVYEEDGHKSWQIGDFEGHHCHLDLDSIVAAEFFAEPVSCQGGRLNWTIWFDAAGDAGNPYRKTAVVSVTLNKPYRKDGSVDSNVVAPVYDLWRKWQSRAGITANQEFESALAGLAPSAT